MDLLGEAVSFAGIEEAMADIEKSAQNTELSDEVVRELKCSYGVPEMQQHNHQPFSHPQPLINRGVQRRTEGREMLISFFSIVH